MTFPHVRAVKLSGETFALDENLQVAAKALEIDGCLLVKGATDLKPVEPTMEARCLRKGFEKTSGDDGSLDIGLTLDSVARDVYLNRVSCSTGFQSVLTASLRSLVPSCSQLATVTLSPPKTLSSVPTTFGSGWDATPRQISTSRGRLKCVMAF